MKKDIDSFKLQKTPEVDNEKRFEFEIARKYDNSLNPKGKLIYSKY